MQDQLTGGQSSLQQQQGNLQQNTSNLQQSGSPTTSGDTSSVLSEAAPQGQLRVTTATSPTPSKVVPSTVQPGSNGAWLWLLLIPLVIIAIALIPRSLVAAPEVEPIEDPALSPTPVAKPLKKTKKKSTKRKKSSRR
jgi:hypothetical protein